MYFDGDFYGWFEQCIQCSYLREVKKASEVQKGEAETETDS